MSCILIRNLTVYGVCIPETDGRVVMAAIIPAIKVDNFDMRGLVDTVTNGLPHYAVPKFVRFIKAFETTETHKIKKSVYRKEAFDPSMVFDPLYVLLPNRKEYISLTTDIYNDLKKGKYRF